MVSVHYYPALIICFLTAISGKQLVTDKTSNAEETSVKSVTSLGKVLFVSVVASKSHKNYFYGIVEALAFAGYEVTFISPYHPKKMHKNIKEVVLESHDLELYAADTFKDGTSAHILTLFSKGPELCLKALSSEEVSEVLKENYDIAFVSMFFNECFLGYINSLNIPFVFVSPMEMVVLFSGLRIGNPCFPSIDYDPMLPFSSPKTFVQRFLSVMQALLVETRLAFMWHRIDSEARNQGLFPPNTPYLPSIFSNASLVIFNSFRMMEHPRPYMPNVLLVSGMHLRPPKSLPKDLDEWVESAGDAGIIFFSLGSFVPASTIPLQTVRVLLAVFKSLKQKVLWKFNHDDVGAELPPNLRLTTWAPQQDLLGHEKMRLFISHGGLSSIQEAIYHNVPVLGMPVFGDQFGNMAQAESQGWGVTLHWEDVTYDRFRSAILRLIDDTKARERLAAISDQMRDQPSDPAADVMWWTGYILRTGGARHLRSGALHLSWLELYNVDVWATVAFVLALLLWLNYKLLRALCACLCCRRRSDTTSVKQKFH